jgi:hypothetical protein
MQVALLEDGAKLDRREGREPGRQGSSPRSSDRTLRPALASHKGHGLGQAGSRSAMRKIL